MKGLSTWLCFFAGARLLASLDRQEQAALRAKSLPSCLSKTISANKQVDYVNLQQNEECQCYYPKWQNNARTVFERDRQSQRWLCKVEYNIAGLSPDIYPIRCSGSAVRAIKPKRGKFKGRFRCGR